MLGGWCYDNTRNAYSRGKCADATFLLVKRDRFVTVDVVCKFDQINKSPYGNNDGYFVRSTCTDGEEEDDRGTPYPEYQKFRFVGKTLTIRPIGPPGPSPQGESP
jgi:hypothetical protein